MATVFLPSSLDARVRGERPFATNLVRTVLRIESLY